MTSGPARTSLVRAIWAPAALLLPGYRPLAHQDGEDSAIQFRIGILRQIFRIQQIDWPGSVPVRRMDSRVRISWWTAGSSFRPGILFLGHMASEDGHDQPALLVLVWSRSAFFPLGRMPVQQVQNLLGSGGTHGWRLALSGQVAVVRPHAEPRQVMGGTLACNFPAGQKSGSQRSIVPSPTTEEFRLGRLVSLGRDS